MSPTILQMYQERLKESVPRARERIAAALERAGRSGGVRLVAVTKGHPVEAVRAAAAAGLADVGENRVQELEEKRTELERAADAVTWHLIGHLQRNKVRRAIQLFDRIHSIDSLRLARELSSEAVRAGIAVRGLVQVNVSGEESKGGFDANRAVDEIAQVAALPALRCDGLMTMAPFTADESVVRATFAGARDLLERCMREGIALAGAELSMGMSGDFEIAVEEGSTMLRLGTILFGERAQ
ncbi:MAG TPA: YggS family pyridoxal phosphate-dependent enzyme [Longimicrobiales bacterium]|nr:YggS family pyridoxal phosphate-dependent enzyme [Longimicrobiales bacterium]